MNNRLLAYIALAAGILSLTLSAFFVRWADAPAPVFAFYRMGIGGLLITPFFLKAGPGKQIPSSKLLWIPILGGLFTTIDLTLWNTGVQSTTIANATLLGNTAPIWVVLALWVFFKQKFTNKFWIGLVLALGGAAIVLGYDFFLRPHFGVGDTFALISGMFYGGYYLATQYGRKNLNVVPYLWVVSLSATFSLLIVSLVMGYRITGYSTQTYLAFLGAGFVVQCIGYVAIAYALGHLPASIVAPTLILQPVFSALLAIFMFNEQLLPIQWLGTAAVLSGIYLINRSNDPARNKLQVDPVLEDY
jgi:drug/metabolite transporter (DMT)-like permease